MSMFRKITAADEFTGWHMVAVIGLFFGTIISVNLTLAYFAVSSWTGLVVKNSYVESQRFNEVTAERERSVAMGWKSTIAYDDGVVSLTLKKADGTPADASNITAMIGRPAFARDDRKVEFEATGAGVHQARTQLNGGVWQAELVAESGDKTAFKHSIRFSVTE